MASSIIVELINLPNGDIVLEQENYNSDLETTVDRLSKWLVPGLFAVGILCRHDAEAMRAAVGYLANTMLAIMIKRILTQLTQERRAASGVSELGVPSLHAQSIFYIVIFAISSVVHSLGITVITLTMSGFALAFSSYLSWIPVSHRLHTLSQVIVGGTLGTIFSILWYWSWNVAVHEPYVFRLLGSNS
ncbi:lipid phosphate phosphatase epsilon 2, chloroplastic-like [Rosa rugosa]|uniref:lipid phosphate phosphatase epsilon 2, chloroplastic-like n=1 Tax=Rosa rugosa TaxID=74645 RepID=UPI002B417CB7|nr:lipid phosphate phosphatase epsilon 2, chloroplastic-like [Rosa rugosa]